MYDHIRGVGGRGRLTMVICGGSCTYDHIRGVVRAW